jgi:hypothetical protein
MIEFAPLFSFVEVSAHQQSNPARSSDVDSLQYDATDQMKRRILMTVRSLGVFLCAAALLSASPARTQGQELQKPNAPRLKAYVTVKPAKGLDMEKTKSELAATGATASSILPLFTYNVEARRHQLVCAPAAFQTLAPAQFHQGV